ncbi:ABC transporter permease [Pseudoroseicyclus tamaricis]|uniref:ABC transporter permease n=1 Tax=Pseudoroseicyclus tamaricis TaxID=2705421 RepID=A0A6B2JY15_9RHOB|nr:ABC transporter permease [Pseudoroseicyclus tamaricis]NDV01174.1 ABC transporter permease [Pseudoroseicyclus tamaricis]
MTDAAQPAPQAARARRRIRWPKALRSAPLIAGALISATIILLAIFAPFVATHDLTQMDMPNRFSGPSAEHWLGTDNFGRDLWSRLVYGARISVTIAIIAVTLSAIIGTVIGLVAGYFGGWVDLLLMRLTDIFLGFPPLVLVLAVVAVVGPGLLNVALSLVIVSWTEYARVVRSTTLSLREQNFVLAARAIGASPARILWREVLPNSLGPIIVLASLGLGTAIIWESALSFLGFGLPPPAPTWGWSLSYGTRFMREDPWMSIISGAAIMVTVLGFNLLGDGLRDLLDPRHQTRGKS